MSNKLIKLHKPNCVPCQAVENFLQSSGVEYDSFNVMEQRDLAVKFNIMSVPVVVLLDENDTEIGRVGGFNPPALQELVDQLQG